MEGEQERKQKNYMVQPLTTTFNCGAKKKEHKKNKMSFRVHIHLQQSFIYKNQVVDFVSKQELSFSAQFCNDDICNLFKNFYSQDLIRKGGKVKLI